MSNTNVTSIAERQKAVEEERQNFVAGLPQFLKLNEGSNTVEITGEDVTEGKFGYLYPAIVNGKTGVLSLKGILEQEVLKALKNSNKMQIVRVGLKEDTRYKVVS